MLAWRIIPGQIVTVMMDVTPDHATAAEVVTVTGFGLGTNVVRDVYLLEGKHAYSVEIVEQTGTLLRFRIPTNVPPGRKRLAAAVAGRADLVEQDLYLTVVCFPDDRPTGVPAPPTGV